MTPSVWKQNDLHVWNNNGRLDVCIHADCKLHIVVERWFWILEIENCCHVRGSETISRCHDVLSGLEELNTRDFALEGSELFGSTKRNFDLSPSVDCDSHWSDKVNYFIPRPNTRVRRTCIEESLIFVQFGVVHTTSVLVTDCSSSH